MTDFTERKAPVEVEGLVEADAIALAICRDVGELPDRTSPEDWPEAMLVTHDELRWIVAERLRDLETENFRLAAGQCAVDGGLIGDDHGHFGCSLQAENKLLRERLLESQMLAFKWMDAHDKRAAGEAYDYPCVADLPNALAELATLKQQLAEREEALRPFATYASNNGFCLEGLEIPDSEEVGWGSLTVGDFRRAARALTRTDGGDR